MKKRQSIVQSSCVKALSHGLLCPSAPQCVFMAFVALSSDVGSCVRMSVYYSVHTHYNK